jgi:hypothetical protein
MRPQIGSFVHLVVLARQSRSLIRRTKSVASEWAAGTVHVLALSSLRNRNCSLCTLHLCEGGHTIRKKRSLLETLNEILYRINHSCQNRQQKDYFTSVEILV